MRVLTCLAAVCLLLLNSNAFSQSSKECKDVKTGIFKIADESNGVNIIKRSARFQTEINEEMGIELVLEIKWLDECTYQLKLVKVVKGDPAMLNNAPRLTTHITEVTENGYRAESKMEGMDAIVKVELIRIE